MADRKFNTGLTETEVRTAFSRALNDMSDTQIQALVNAETTARQQADARLEQSASRLSASLASETAARALLQTTVTAQLDSGAKNLLTVGSGSNTASLRYIEIPCTAKAGTYVLYFGHLESTDTDSETCAISFKDTNAVDVGATDAYQFARGDGVYKVITLKNDNLARIRIYSANNFATSASDIVTFSEAMLCTKAAWDLSQEYVPYCPTLRELYEAMLSMNGAALLNVVRPDLARIGMEIQSTATQSVTEPEAADA